MKSHTDNHSHIVNYLLGRLPESELDELESRYLHDEDLFQELQEIEDELIDDYASGVLPTEQKKSFEEYFLRSAERREKLTFAQAMTKRAIAWQQQTVLAVEAREPAESTSSGEKRRGSKLWEKPVPAWRQWAAVAAALVFAIGSGTLWLRNRELRRQLVAADTNNEKLRREAEVQSTITAEKKAELSAEQKQSQMLETQLEQLQTSTVDEIHDVIVNVALDIGYLVQITRGGEKKVKTLDVPANTRLLRLSLEVGEAPFESFNLLLRRGDESIAWRRSGLKAREIGNRRKLNLTLPAENLNNAEYDLIITGVPAEGDAELVGHYYLKVVRKRATK
jgi:phage terminase Nu1 subunit (DNA packaging protein)